MFDKLVSDEEVQTLLLQLVASSATPVTREDFEKHGQMLVDFAEQARTDAAVLRLFLDGKLDVCVDEGVLKWRLRVKP